MFPLMQPPSDSQNLITACLNSDSKFWFVLQGLGKEFIFSHHQKAYEGNRISWYDQQFNKREITESRLPPLRSWDRQKLAWAPEKSDYPIQGLYSLNMLFAILFNNPPKHTNSFYQDLHFDSLSCFLGRGPRVMKSHHNKVHQPHTHYYLLKFQQCEAMLQITRAKELSNLHWKL